MDIHVINTILVIIAIIAMLRFGLKFSLNGGWWKTRIGRNLMASYLSTCAYMSSVSLEKTFDVHHMNIVRTIALIAFIFTIFQRTHFMMQAQNPDLTSEGSKADHA